MRGRARARPDMAGRRKTDIEALASMRGRARARPDRKVATDHVWQTGLQ